MEDKNGDWGFWRATNDGDNLDAWHLDRTGMECKEKVRKVGHERHFLCCLDYS